MAESSTFLNATQYKLGRSFILAACFFVFASYPLILILVPTNLAYHFMLPGQIVLACLALPLIFAWPVTPPRYLLAAVLVYILNGVCVSAWVYMNQDELILAEFFRLMAAATIPFGVAIVYRNTDWLTMNRLQWFFAAVWLYQVVHSTQAYLRRARA